MNSGFFVEKTFLRLREIFGSIRDGKPSVINEYMQKYMGIFMGSMIGGGERKLRRTRRDTNGRGSLERL